MAMQKRVQPEESHVKFPGAPMCQIAKAALALSILLTSCTSESHVLVGANTDVGDTAFACPLSGCVVATDPNYMAILVLHQTDTPSDNGAFDSASRTKMYNDAVAAGSILTVADCTHGKRVYQTPPVADNPITYSVVELLEGSYSGRRVVVRDAYLR